MLANFVDALGIVVASLVGVLLKRGIPERINDAIMKALGVTIFYIGIQTALKAENSLMVLVSIVVGTLIGEFAKIDDKIVQLGLKLERKITKKSEGEGSGDNKFAEAFVTTSIIYCSGALAIVASIQAGLSGDGSLLYVKTMLDGVVSVVFAATLGIGVLFSSVPVFLYQAIFVLCASFLSPYLGDPVVASISGVGGVTMIATALNITLGTEIKIANITPAVAIPIVLGLFGIGA